MTGKRRSKLRLEGYDYARGGVYFVTICTRERAPLFGEVILGEMVLNEAGRSVVKSWQELKDRFSRVDLDAFVVMPDHIHGVVVLRWHWETKTICRPGVTRLPTQDMPIHQTLSAIVGAFKSITTVRYTRGVRYEGWRPFRKKLWQRGFFDRVFRDERALDNVRRYIANNPRSYGQQHDGRSR